MSTLQIAVDNEPPLPTRCATLSKDCGKTGECSRHPHSTQQREDLYEAKAMDEKTSGVFGYVVREMEHRAKHPWAHFPGNNCLNGCPGFTDDFLIRGV